MKQIYFGLGRSDRTEPLPESGYSRIAIETSADPDSINLSDLQLTFPEAVGAGYGVVTTVMLFDSADAVQPRRSWNLPQPADVHAGVTPVIHKGNLIRGIDISARILLHTATAAKQDIS